jgi:hypothetical protein
MHREGPEDWFWQGSPTVLALLILMPKVGKQLCRVGQKLMAVVNRLNDKHHCPSPQTKEQVL